MEFDHFIFSLSCLQIFKEYVNLSELEGKKNKLLKPAN